MTLLHAVALVAAWPALGLLAGQPDDNEREAR